MQITNTSTRRKDWDRLMLSIAFGGDFLEERITCAQTYEQMGECTALVPLAAQVVNGRDIVGVVSDPRRAKELEMARKTIDAGILGSTSWASSLASWQTLYDDRVLSMRNEFLMPAMVASGMIHAVPGIRLPVQTLTGPGATVAEVAWKPTSRQSYVGLTTSPFKTNTCGIYSKEMARFGGPGAERLITTSLRNGVGTAGDLAAIAVIVSGLTPIVSSNSSRADLREAFNAVDMGQFSRPLIFAAPKLVKQMALDGTADGPMAYPDMVMPTGGSISGVPVLAIDALHDLDAYGDCLIVLDATQFAGAMMGMNVTASGSASILMDASPSGPAQLVSMFQTNSVAVLAEEFFTLERVRDTAAAFVTGCSYGSGSSPA